MRRKVVELDRRYRSTWGARELAFTVGLSPTTAAKILREERGPRPARPRPLHARRTRFLRCDVMWASDFLDLGAKGKVLVTVDERSLFKLGWSLCARETAAAVIEHARRLLYRRKRRPLVWKFDHGSAFTGGEFRDFLFANQIVPYVAACRAPWTNGRCERGHREVRDWLLRAGKDLARELARGMRIINFAKPRPVLGFRRAAQVYFRDGGIGSLERRRFLLELQRLSRNRRGERAQRLAVKAALARRGLYEELRPVRGTK